MLNIAAWFVDSSEPSKADAPTVAVMCSEQSSGILLLLALALFAGAQAWESAKQHEWPEYSQPSCQIHGDYVGRVEGRAKFEYGEICYE